MPTYQYRCKDCSHDFEIVQSFADDALTVCDRCGGSLRKVFGNVGIAFKGSGFYKTDSKGEKKGGSTWKPSETSKSGSDAGASSGSSGSSDSGGSSSGSSGSTESTSSSGSSSSSDSASSTSSHSHGPGTHTH